MPVDCPELKCCDPNLFGYVLANAPTYSNTEQSFILECPPGYDCEPGEYPREIIVPPGTITLPCFGDPVECQEMVDEIAIEEIKDGIFPGSPPNPPPIEALFVNTPVTDVQTCDPPAAESPLTINVPLGSTFAELAALASALPKGNPVTVNVPAGQTKSKISTANAVAEAQFIAQTIALARQECVEAAYPPGAIAYWSFDDVLTDSTGNGRTLAPWDVGDPLTYAAGRVANGIQLGRDFNIATNFLRRTDDAFNFGGNVDKSFTMAGWFKCNFHDNPVWLSFGVIYTMDQPATGVSLKASFRSTTTNELLDSLFTPTLGVLFFAVIQWDHSVHRGYIEINRTGRVQSSVLGPLDSDPGASLFMGWGSTLGPDAQNNLIFDELGFWPRFLSSTELDYLYNSGNGRAYNT